MVASPWFVKQSICRVGRVVETHRKHSNTPISLGGSRRLDPPYRRPARALFFVELFLVNDLALALFHPRRRPFSLEHFLFGPVQAEHQDELSLRHRQPVG